MERRTTDYPYLAVYPELEVINLLLGLIVAIAVLGNFVFVGLTIGFHISHLLGVVSPEWLRAFAIVHEYLGQHGVSPLLMRLADIGVIVVALVYTRFLWFLTKLFLKSTRHSITRLRTVGDVDYSVGRVRRIIAHALVADIGFLVGMYAVIFLWLHIRSVVFESWSILSAAVVVVGFIVTMTALLLVTQLEAGHRFIDAYFRIVGGYEDGSTGRKLHRANAEVEDILSESEVERLQVPSQIRERP